MADTEMPCPFCGSHDIIKPLSQNDAPFVECLDCGAIGPLSENPGTPTQAWNRRAAPSVDVNGDQTCPFCGEPKGEVVEATKWSREWIICGSESCGAFGPDGGITEWNKRHAASA